MTHPGSRWADAFFFFSLLCFCAFVLWLPVFPTGDGPLHIYFSSILWELATRPTIYSTYFAIRHLVQPYSLHYFALIALEHVASTAMAEKLCVVGVLLCQALGFRFLARRLGPHASYTSLLIVPLLFSWCLGGGFLNFCFSIGVAMFAFGFWFSLPDGPGNDFGDRAPDPTHDPRHDPRHGTGKARTFPTRTLAGFLLTLFVLVLSHPIPLMVLILFTAGDMLLLLIEQWRTARRANSRLTLKDVASLRWRLVAFAMACLAFVAPAMLADKSQVESVWRELGPHLWLIKRLVEGNRVSLFAGTSPAALLYQGAVLAAIPIVLLLQWKSLRRHAAANTLAPSHRLLVLALLYTLAVTCFPRNLNGSGFFAERMWAITWPLILVTLAGASLSPRMQRIIACTGVAWILLTVALAVQTLTPIARKQALLAAAPLPDAQRGIFLAAPYADPTRIIHTHYNEFFWSAGRAFSAHHDILLNSPWLTLTILPIRERSGARMLVNTEPGKTVEDPMRLYDAMHLGGASRDLILADTDFILYADPLGSNPQPLAEIDALLAGERLQWSCTAANFYAVCVRRR